MPQIYRYDKSRNGYVPGGRPEAPGLSRPPLAAGALAVLAIGGALALGVAKSLPAPAAPKPEPADPLAMPLAASKVEPRFGRIKLGAFAGEIADVCALGGQSIQQLSRPESYKAYRAKIREVYGLDLEDMNYFNVAKLGWGRTIPELRDWLLMAGQFGDVTLALEPVGFYQYDEFVDSPEMRALRRVFREAEERGITVWVRYASEANLYNNPYAASISKRHARLFYEKAVWLKSYMPPNVKLVFSPLINTSVAARRRQFPILRRMFYGGERRSGRLPWDRIGGTIYRTDLPLEPTFDAYYRFMSGLAPELPFQICELGGPYRRRAELARFLRDLAAGKWPKVQKVNLFARDINRRADPDGSFGYIEPRLRAAAAARAKSGQAPGRVESWLKAVLAEGPLPVRR